MRSISIVIPTILKPGVLDTVYKAIEFTKNTALKIEVVINPLRQGTPEYGMIERQLLRNRSGNVEIRYHERVHLSAESSALYAAASSESDYIWILGDEDLPTPSTPKHLIELADCDEADFWLLNAEWSFASDPIKYYQVGPQTTYLTSGMNFFNKLGFVGITTALSCWFIRREIIDLEQFERFHQRSKIYSHTFSLAAFLSARYAGISNNVCVIRKEENASTIKKALEVVTRKDKVDVSTVWIEGLLALASQLSEELGVGIPTILKSREIEMVKLGEIAKQGDLKILVSSTLNVVQRAIESRSESQLSSSPLSSEVLLLSEKIQKSIRQQTSSLVFPSPVRIGF
jgi:hypothetical protein